MQNTPFENFTAWFITGLGLGIGIGLPLMIVVLGSIIAYFKEKAKFETEMFGPLTK